MRGAQRNRVLAAILAVMLSAQAGAAIELTSLPERSLQTLDERLGFDSFVLPVGAYTDGAMATITAEGAVRRRTWQVNGDGLSTLQIIAPLRDEITAAGYETLLSCETDSCGGFDFRYAISVLPAPEMHVDLFDFRVFTARRVDPAQPERGQYLYLLVSRTRSAGFVQLFESNAAQSGGDVAPRAAKDPRVAPAAVPSAGVVRPRHLI